MKVLRIVRSRQMERQVRTRSRLFSALAGRWFVWIGGVAIAIGGLLFVKYAYDNGLISPVMQIVLGIAAGLASSGLIPFVSSFACFAVCKTYDQLRMSVAYPGMNVKVVTSHGGISVGEDGASQQSIEDIALMVTLPHFIVAVPSDQYAASALIRQAAAIDAPVYIRTCRPKTPIVHAENGKFSFGKGVRLRKGKDVCLIANGLMVFEALQAAERLAREGILASVVDMHTIKPLDEELIVEEARLTGAIVTAEEHQIWGGLGAHTAQLVASRCPVPVQCVAIQDTYAESGHPDELLEKYGLTASHIHQAALKAVKQKKQGR
jgi:transketolase